MAETPIIDPAPAATPELQLVDPYHPPQVQADDGQPVSPQEAAAVRKQAGVVDPMLDMTPQELADLQHKFPEKFNMHVALAARPDLTKDPESLQRVADAHNLLTQTPKNLTDYERLFTQAPENIGGLFSSAWGTIKHLVSTGPLAVGASLAGGISGGDSKAATAETARNFLEGLLTTHAGQEALAKQATDMVREGYQSTEDTLAHPERPETLATLIQGPLAGGAKLFLPKTAPTLTGTPQDRVAQLGLDIGLNKPLQDAIAGHTSWLDHPEAKKLNDWITASGYPVRPEEIAKNLATEPLSLLAQYMLFKEAGAAIPEAVSEANLARMGATAAETAGKAITGVAKPAATAVKVGAKAAPFAAPLFAAKSLFEGQYLEAFGGYRLAKEAGEKLLASQPKLEALASFGRQVAGAEPVKSSFAQLVKDSFQALPKAGYETAKGAAFDVAMAQGGQTPEEDRGVGIGTLFGLAGGAMSMGGHALSGQLIAPREYGSLRYTPPNDVFPSLNALERTDYPVGIQTRLNTLRPIVRSLFSDKPTEFHYVPRPEPGQPDPLPTALTQIRGTDGSAPVSPEQAQVWASQGGLVSTDVGGKRLVLVRDIDSAPHEAVGHVLENALGESTMRDVDRMIQSDPKYQGQTWDAIAESYASRFQHPKWDPAKQSWQDFLLSVTNWGELNAKEKVLRQTIGEGPYQPGDLDKAWETSGGDWRSILTPEEQNTIANRFLSREIFAENMDAAFKHGIAPDPGMAANLSRYVGQFVRALGGDPLAGRASEVGRFPLSFDVTQVQPKLFEGAMKGKPTVDLTRPSGAPKSFTGIPITLEQRDKAAADARETASTASDTPLEAGATSPRQALGTVAEAIAGQSPVLINRSAAPGEPSAGITSKRGIRRAIIEAWRGVPDSAKGLVQKLFFPTRVIKTKGGTFQVEGWSPEVLAANIQKLAEFAQDHKIALPAGVELDPARRSFTADSWRNIFDSLQEFAANQRAGRTGAGEPLVVPKEVQESGGYAPPIRGKVTPVPQDMADFLNYAYNLKLPETAMIRQGKTPLNIQAQRVSKATLPGRVEIPVEPRGVYGEYGKTPEAREAQRQAAEKLDIAGQQVMEVNPFRQSVEAAAKAAGVEPPDLFETIQHLNAEGIKQIEHAPEQGPAIPANTLTLAAGFQPPRAQELIPALKTDEGKIIPGVLGGTHTDIYNSVPGMEGAMLRISQPEHGFLRGKDFLSREQAADYVGEKEPLQSERLQELQAQGETKRPLFTTDKELGFFPIGYADKIIKPALHTPEAQALQAEGKARLVYHGEPTARNLFAFGPNGEDLGSAFSRLSGDGKMEVYAARGGEGLDEVLRNELTAQNTKDMAAFSVAKNAPARFIFGLEGIKKINDEEVARQLRQAETETSRLSSYAGDIRRGLILHSAKQRSTAFLSPADSKDFLTQYKALKGDRAKSDLIETYFGGGGTSAQFNPRATPELEKLLENSDSVTKDQLGKPKAFFHGTANAGLLSELGGFLKEKFDPNALYGPGVYLTESPEIAGGAFDASGKLVGKGYATGKGGAGEAGVVPAFVKMEKPFDVNKVYTPQEIKQTFGDLLSQEHGDPKPELHKSLRADLTEAVRRIDSHQGPYDSLDTTNEWLEALQEDEIFNNQHPEFGGSQGEEPEYPAEIRNFLQWVRHQGADLQANLFAYQGDALTGHEIYRNLEEKFGGDRSRVNDILQRRGFDGITHRGGGFWTGSGFEQTQGHRVVIPFTPEQVFDLGGKPLSGNLGLPSAKELVPETLLGLPAEQINNLLHEAKNSVTDADNRARGMYPGEGPKEQAQALRDLPTLKRNRDLLQKQSQALWEKRFGSGRSDMPAQYEPPAEEKTPEVTPEIQSFADHIHSTSPQEWTDWAHTVSGGMSHTAHSTGLLAKTPSDLALLRSTAHQYRNLAETAMRSKDWDTASIMGNKAQAAQEAFESATGQSMDGKGEMVSVIRKVHNPNYQPPMPAQFQAATPAGKELERRGYKVIQDDFGPATGMVSFRITTANNKPVGYIEITQTSPTEARVNLSKVESPFQGKGFGETLYREAATELQKRGVELLGGNIVHPAPEKIRNKLFGEPISREEAGGTAWGGTAWDTTHRIPPDVQFNPPEEDKNAPPFYSQLSRVVDSKFSGAQMPAQQLAAILKNPQNGVKSEELKWSGLDDYLQGKQKVTKAEVQEYLQQNAVQVSEVTRGGPKAISAELQAYLDDNHGGEIPGTLEGWQNLADRIERKAQWWQTNRDTERANRLWSAQQEALNAAEGLDPETGSGTGQPKFANYQLPGGENYRELLFQLPEKPVINQELESLLTVRPTKDQGVTKYFIAKGDDLNAIPGNFRTREDAEQRRKELIESRPKPFTSSHWDEPNVVAHTRVNDRTDSDGNPGLFSEEIQSDWHQKGRKEGYKTDVDTTGWRAVKKPSGGFDVFDARGNLQTVVRAGYAVTPEEALWQAAQQLNDKGVPDAPFKNTWHEMVLRRLVRMAAEEGKDWVGWTTGEQQAERYDLSKQVSEIGVVNNGDGTYALNAKMSQGLVTLGMKIPANEIADHVGKDLADKIVNNQGARKMGEPEEFQSFTGTDLKVGGEGMKGFYDKILVDYANKFGKKFGARVEERRVPAIDHDVEPPTGEPWRESELQTVHALPITPEMRASVLREGVAQFNPREDESEPRTFIVRHGSTSMNADNPADDKIRGWSNPALSEQGQQEATKVAEELKAAGVGTIITSDLKRARQTADAISEATGAKVVEDPRLRPWHLGPSIEGHPTEKMLPVIQSYVDSPDKAPPRGESFNTFKDRFLEGFHDAQEKHPDENTALVTHYRGSRLMDAWRDTGVDNDTINSELFSEYDSARKPGTFDTVDKTGAEVQFNPPEEKRRWGIAALRMPDGAIIKSQPGGLHYHARQIADQKGYSSADIDAAEEGRINLNTGKFVSKKIIGEIPWEISKSGQFTPPKKAEDWKLKPGSGGFSKAWITPEGKPIQLGGQWHHEWMAENPEVRKQYGIPAPKDLSTGGGEEIREAALKKGFARINYGQNQGALTVEARAADWVNLRPAVEALVKANAGKLDHMTVHLFDRNVKRLMDSGSEQLFRYSDREKLEHLPLISQPGEVTEMSPQARGTQYQPGHRTIGTTEDDLSVEAIDVPKDDAVTHGREAPSGDHNWRYDHDTKRLYWWTFPEDLDPDVKQETHAWLKKKGLSVSKDQFLNERDDASDAKFRAAHVQYSPFASPKFDDELEKIRSGESGGQTFAPTGEIWAPPASPSDLVSLASVNIPLGKLTREAVEKVLAPYADLLDEPGVAAGMFAFSKDGQPTVSIDLNAIVDQKHRKNTLDFAKQNDQVAIWDAAKGQEVSAGGKGDTKLTSPGELLDALATLRMGKPTDVSQIMRENRESGRPEEPTLFGAKPPLTTKQLSDMTKADIAKHFPEAVIPRSRNEEVPSDILNSPLAKSSDKPVEAFARKLVEFAKEYQDHPSFKSGTKWYSEFVPKIKKVFGKDAPIFAELLAGTSPQQPPTSNYAMALDALQGYKTGRFEKNIKGLEKGLDKIKDGSWRRWLDREIKAGSLSNPPEEPTADTFINHWVDKHNLTPRQSNGKLYAVSSDAVLKILARRWLENTSGLKTQNFVQNLLGTGHEATIDLWADRTMRRIGYSGSKERWRILPKNAAGVSDADFRFSQAAFRKAAEELGIKPDALQGGLWFAEKQLWADKGWGRLDLGDFRKEIEKTEMLKAGIEQRLKVSKAKPRLGEQLGLDMVEPRPGFEK